MDTNVNDATNDNFDGASQVESGASDGVSLNGDTEYDLAKYLNEKPIPKKFEGRKSEEYKGGKKLPDPFGFSKEQDSAGDDKDSDSNAESDTEAEDLDLDLLDSDSDEDTNVEHDEDSDTDPVFEIQVDGKKIEVKKSELIADAQKWRASNDKFATQGIVPSFSFTCIRCLSLSVSKANWSEDDLYEHIVSEAFVNNNELREWGNKHQVNWGTCYLPHDGAHRDFKTGQSAQEIMQAFGWRVEITPTMTIEAGIRAAKQMFGNVIFDRDSTTLLLENLKRYHYAERPDGSLGKPVHDNYSHGADAFRYLAVNIESLQSSNQTSSWGKPINYKNTTVFDRR